MNELILTEAAAIEAYETNNPSDDHATGVRLVALAQAMKILAEFEKIKSHGFEDWKVIYRLRKDIASYAKSPN
jgi:hypothetical protein